ncbi:MAG: hypothetical protein AB1522_13130 [Chloroflexota bacterium]
MKRVFTVMILPIIMLLAACNGRAEQQKTPEPEKVELPVGILDSLSRNLEVEREQIEFNQITQLSYSDSCMGIPSVDEQCAQMVIEGFQGIISLNGAQYEFRSDQSGERIRIIPIALKAAQSKLANQLNISPEFVRWVSIEKVDWPDSCLGLEQAGITCNTVITPGFKITLEAGGTIFVFRTDLTGSQAVLEMFSD